MARTTIRVDLPNASPADLVKLLESVSAQHDSLETAQAGSSPLDDADVAAIKAILAEAKPARTQAEQLAAQASALFESSNKRLGLAGGQNLRTEGTGLFYAAKVRDALLASYRGKENAMEPFGFKVVIGSAASPKRQAAKTA